MQLGSTLTPRSAKSSETCSYANGYRKYQRTHSRITSPGKWRHLKGLVAVIGIRFLPYQTSHRFSQGNRCIDVLVLACRDDCDRGGPIACQTAHPVAHPDGCFWCLN